MIDQNKKRTGDLLVKSGLITPDQLQYALEKQHGTDKKLGAILVEEKIVKESEIIQVLEGLLGIPHVEIENYNVDPEIPRLISETLARKLEAIPISRVKNKLTVAMIDPLNIYAIDDIRIATGLDVVPVITSTSSVQNALGRFYNAAIAEKAVEDFTKQLEMIQVDVVDEDIENDIKNAPIVRLLDSVLKQALKSRASDIHIEPSSDRVVIRFRVDGVLQEIMSTTKSTHAGLIARIKIISKLDISEKRLPQDGGIEMSIDGKLTDLRVSTLPTIYGEKVVLRLLDRNNFLMTKTDLGFTDNNMMKFNEILKSPNGIILVTGPTGSGKSTTLYAALNELNVNNKNIVTVEDPVEYRLPGISQVQVNSKIGLDFAMGLKAILRQDPDIIMIGEIRDTETAQNAVRAAITGHLVLSTLHTNDTSSTISRLMDMGVETYLVASSITGIIAQRLIRVICNNCKQEYIPIKADFKFLNISQENHPKMYYGKGCLACGSTGYKGRTTIHEVMNIDKNIRQLINSNADGDMLREAAIANGMVTLKQNAVELVLKGVTTMEEAIKVAYGIDD